jgi:hypothetical protein
MRDGLITRSLVKKQQELAQSFLFGDISQRSRDIEQASGEEYSTNTVD